MIAPQQVRPLRRREYDRLVAEGAFRDERVELLRGMLVAMSPQGQEHAQAVMLLNRLLTLAIGTRAFVRPQLPLALGDESEPEPDLAVVAGLTTAGHPESALLVVEVSDSSVNVDRNVKAPLYAEASIPEFWLVDLGRRRVELYSVPVEGRYSQVRYLQDDDELVLSAFSDVRVPVSAFLLPRTQQSG